MAGVPSQPNEAETVPWDQILGWGGVILLLILFVAWCIWAGRRDGLEYGPRL